MPARETPIFSCTFPVRSISLSQNLMSKYSAPEHDHFTFFCRFGDHNFRNFFTFLPIIAATRPAYSGRARSGAPHFQARATRARSRAPPFFTLPSALRGLAAGQSVSQTRQTYTVHSGTRIFHARAPPSSLRSPAFSRSCLNSEPPIFHFAAAHTYQNLGWVPPPPPTLPWCTVNLLLSYHLTMQKPCFKQHLI